MKTYKDSSRLIQTFRGLSTGGPGIGFDFVLKK